MQPGTMISSDQVVGFTSDGHTQQKCVKRIIYLDSPRQSSQDFRPLQVVDHGPNPIGLEYLLEFWIAAGPAYFFQLNL